MTTARSAAQSSKSKRRDIVPPKMSPRPGAWDSFLEQHESRIILVLCILAGLRVLLFAAGFPVYNNVDEGAHFDLICKYSMGHFPKHIEHYSEEASKRIAFTYSPEYNELPPGKSPSSVPNPLWMTSKSEIEFRTGQAIPFLRQKTNHEATQPPLYYVIAGAWFRIGKLIGLDGGHLVYWLKLIDVLVYVPLVWLSYLFARRFYRQNPFMRFGVPLLLVVFPQDVFYSLNNDILTPILFGLAFYCLTEAYVSERKSYGFHALTGLAVAATFLNKFTNAPILLIFAAVLFLRLLKLRSDGRLKVELPKLAVMFLMAALPIALWLIRDCVVLGDITGMAAKVKRMGWTAKPFAAIWHHPIFTPAGAVYFWNGLMKTYWRGEIVWLGKVVASSGVDLFYVLSTTVFAAASVVGMWVSRKTPSEERSATILGLCAFGVSVMFIGALSTLYDYGRCFYPSQASPYLTSGRLLSGTMIPFAAVYIYGLDFLLSRIGLANKRWMVLFAIVTVILISEIAVSEAPFASLYNWYHML